MPAGGDSGREPAIWRGHALVQLGPDFCAILLFCNPLDLLVFDTLLFFRCEHSEVLLSAVQSAMQTMPIQTLRPKRMQAPTLKVTKRCKSSYWRSAADTGTLPQQAVVAGGLCRYCGHCGRSPHLDGGCRTGREQRELHESDPDIEGTRDFAMPTALGFGEEGRKH